MTSLDNSATEERQLALHAWSAHVLRARDLQLVPLNGDASFRRYFRVSATLDKKYPALLAVDAPPATEDTPQFIAIAQTLARAGLTTPKIFFADTDNGFLLIEDFGDALLSKALNATTDLAATYAQPLQTLAQLQRTAPAPALLPTYDADLLQRELALFNQWFVEGLLGHHCDQDELTLLERSFALFIGNALAQPSSWVHRDYHSRNMLLCSDATLGLIDFQGAVWGPITYDLVSLLKDCYWELPASEVSKLALTHLAQLRAQGSIDEEISDAQFLRWFDLMGLQRHLKVLGIFARLHLRDHKPHYLGDLPRVLQYVREAANRYPDTTPLTEWIDNKLMPLIVKQDWYKGAASR